MKTTKILLQGYIGHGNFGDDLLFEIAIERLKKIDNIEISVVITSFDLNTDYLYNYFPKLNIIKFSSKLPLLFYKKFDKIYYIGGGILFDYKTRLGLFSFYKSYFSNLIRYKLPTFFGTDFGGIGVGIGPYFHVRTQRLHQQIISSFDILGVRDSTSYQYATSMKVKNLFLSNDLSINYKINSKLEDNDLVSSNEIIICPRTYKHKPSYEKHIFELVKFANFLQSKNYKTHWIFLQKDNTEVIKQIQDQFKLTIWEPMKMTSVDFINLFNSALVVFSSRMHSLFMAGLVNTPFVAITLHPKLKFASELFYKDPITLHPESSVEEYKLAFELIKLKKFDKSELNNEIHILNELESKFEEWIQK